MTPRKTDHEDEYTPSPEERAAKVRLLLAEAAQAEAEADKVKLEHAGVRAQVRQVRAAARMAEIALEEQTRAQAEDNASDWDSGVFRVNTEITGSGVAHLIDRLMRFSRLFPEAPIEIIFNSPGGSVIAGMALFDVLQELRGKGHHITTGTYGWAASMAGILLQAGDLRYCGTESYILIHEVSSFAMGKIGEIEDEVTFLNMMTARVINIFVKRSGGKLKESVLKKNWNRKDWYVDSTQALELGIVDEVR